MGVIGKGDYNFCKDLTRLNSIIAKEINIANSPWVSDFNIKCSLDKENIINSKRPELFEKKDIINTSFIIERKKLDKINLEITYIIDNNEKIEKKYDIIPKEINEGEELSILIIKDYIYKIDDDLQSLDKSLKYQILNGYTSLFAEIELSDKISEEMKLKIIGDKNKNVIEKLKDEPKSFIFGNMSMVWGQ